MTVRFSPGRLKLLSSASTLPGALLTNSILFNALEKNSGVRYSRLAKKLASRMGIESRYWCRNVNENNNIPTPNAIELCAQTLQSAVTHIDNNMRFGYLIGHTSTPHTLLPPNIAWVAENIAHQSPYMELRQACTGFANSLQIAEGMLNNDASLDPIGIVGSEVGSVYFDYNEAFLTIEQLINYVQMGDGAGTVIVSQDDGSSQSIISDMYIGHIGLNKKPGFYLDGGGSANVICEKKLPVFRHDAQSVRAQGEALFIKGLEAIQGRGYSIDDFDYILPHQANGHIARLLGERLNIASEKIVNDAKMLGNLGSAAIWVSFDRLRKSGKLKEGDKVLVLGAEATKYLYGGFVYQH